MTVVTEETDSMYSVHSNCPLFRSFFAVLAAVLQVIHIGASYVSAIYTYTSAIIER